MAIRNPIPLNPAQIEILVANPRFSKQFDYIVWDNAPITRYVAGFLFEILWPLYKEEASKKGIQIWS